MFCQIYRNHGNHFSASRDIDTFDIARPTGYHTQLIPDYTNEGDYRHPDPAHAQFGCYVKELGNYTSINTGGHLGSVFFGRSETMTIKDGKRGGEFAHIYFIDWNHVRARHRQVSVAVMGTTENVESRKYKGGEVVNTLRKFTEEETAYEERFDLQQKG